MKNGWTTLAIGRHLVDVPTNAGLIQQWKYDETIIDPLPIKSMLDFARIVDLRQAQLKMATHKKHGNMFIERVPQAQGSVTLVSWDSPDSDLFYFFDSFFRAGAKAVKYSDFVSANRKQSIVEDCNLLSTEWREVKEGEIPIGPGFVTGEMMLSDQRFNPESWDLTIRLANKPDVALRVRAFAQDAPEPSLRTRAGGIVAGMFGMAGGLVRLRNRERPVGPIWAEEILVAGTQNGKRAYGFKWEAPGKGSSLAEPQINISLEVGESAYTTNAQSFTSDEEALALWDTLVESIRLRPGAV